MKLFRVAALGLSVFGAFTTSAQAGGYWSVGVRFGGPCYGRPCYGYPYYGCYRPYPLVIAPSLVVAPAPPPVVVQQVPVVVQAAPAPVTSSAPPADETAPPPTPVPPAPALQPATAPLPIRPVSQQKPADDQRQAEIGRLLRQLADPNEGTRIQAVSQLGRLKAHRAVDPLAATLAGDRSAAVREAAARALALIHSPKALPALTHAAQVDSDRDVRRSAQFAVEIIQAK